MAVNRIRGALAAPRKGETFELRAGLVYGFLPEEFCAYEVADLGISSSQYAWERFGPIALG